jgi:hypothetical protein
MAPSLCIFKSSPATRFAFPSFSQFATNAAELGGVWAAEVCRISLKVAQLNYPYMCDRNPDCVPMGDTGQVPSGGGWRLSCFVDSILWRNSPSLHGGEHREL